MSKEEKEIIEEIKIQEQAKESWKDYTIRDKILLSSAIVPLIIFVLSFFLMILYIFEDGRGDVSKLLNSETCGQLTFTNYGSWTPSGFDNDFCSVDLTYAIHPNFLLLSTISLGIYAFFSIKSNKEVSNLFFSETSSMESSKSVFLYKYYVNVLSIIFLVLIFMFSVPMFDIYEAYPEVDESAPGQDVEVYSHCYDLERYFSLTCYTETYAVDFNGRTYKERPFVMGNLLSFLFLPNVLATFIFAYKSRNKYNLKEEWDNLEIKTHDSFEEYYAENIDEEILTRRKRLKFAKSLVEKNEFENAIEIFGNYEEGINIIPELKRRQAEYHEKLLEFDEAANVYKELGMDDEVIRIRKIKSEQGSVKVTQKVVHGDEVTEIKDSVLNRSNVGGKSSKAEEIKEIKELLDSGAIDDAEFKQMKKEILGK